MVGIHCLQENTLSKYFLSLDHLYGFALQQLHVNLSFGLAGRSAEPVFSDHLIDELLQSKPSQQKNVCLVHLFTGRQIVGASKSRNSTLSGVALRGGLFQKSLNVGATSVTGPTCESLPWHVKCFLRFVRSLVHSMGASKDVHSNDFLMGHSESISSNSFVSLFYTFSLFLILFTLKLETFKLFNQNYYFDFF